jgi:hypothetical protein
MARTGGNAMKMYATAVVWLAAAIIAGCDGGAKKPADSPTADSLRHRPGSAVSSAEQSGKGRNLAPINVCVLMPSELVARLLGEQAVGGGIRRDHGIYAQGCDYRLRGPAGGENIFIDLHPAYTFGGLEEALQSQRSMGQNVSGTRVTGIGTEAFAVENRTEQSITLHVLRRGELTVVVKTTSLPRAHKLAVATLERLDEK